MCGMGGGDHIEYLTVCACVCVCVRERERGGGDRG